MKEYQAIHKTSMVGVIKKINNGYAIVSFSNGKKNFFLRRFKRFFKYAVAEPVELLSVGNRPAIPLHPVRKSAANTRKSKFVITIVQNYGFRFGNKRAFLASSKATERKGFLANLKKASFCNQGDTQ